jgi:hypothetical protein
VTFETVLFHAGLACAAVGLLLLLARRVLARRRAVLLAASGLALALLAALLPAGDVALAGPPMRLDGIVPRYQFGESHDVFVRASRARVWRALLDVRADEIRFFRTLTFLRAPHFGGAPEGILNPSTSRPVLDSALASGFVRLAVDEERELVVGLVVCCGKVPRFESAEEFETYAAPDVARAVMNFHIEDEKGGVRLRTQTRIAATEGRARRRFAAYWRAIYPGSAFIRRMWLDAIRRRAEEDR